MDLIEIGRLIKRYDLQMTVSYGSGGYCTVLRGCSDKKEFSGYAWDLEASFQLALKKIKYEREKNTISDEDTKPDIKIDTKYKILNPKE